MKISATVTVEVNKLHGEHAITEDMIEGFTGHLELAARSWVPIREEDALHTEFREAMAEALEEWDPSGYDDYGDSEYEILGVEIEGFPDD